MDQDFWIKFFTSKEVQEKLVQKDIGFDMCAGPGRMSNLMSKYFTIIDVHDQIPLHDKWDERQNQFNKRRGPLTVIENRHVCDLRELEFERDYYDVIWGNWSIFSYLAEKKDVLVALSKCHKALSGSVNGMLICKETTRNEHDSEDYEKQ